MAKKTKGSLGAASESLRSAERLAGLPATAGAGPLQDLRAAALERPAPTPTNDGLVGSVARLDTG